MKSIYSLIFLFLIISAHYAYGQENRYVIYFTDKSESNYSIEEPEKYLSERAIQRRINQNIDITTDDLPVNTWYLDSLRMKGANVYYTSRWFNAAVIQATEIQIGQIQSLTIVDSIVFAAPGAKLSNRINKSYVKPSPEWSAQEEFHNIDSMHIEGYKGEGIWVAVMDAGFLGVYNIPAFQHLFNNGKLKLVKNLITNNDNVSQYSEHGTNVLSLISADGENFTGGAPEASIGLFVTEDVSSEFRIEEYNWLIAAEMADSAGFDIINTSLGYGDFFDNPEMNYEYSDMNGYTAVITKASNFASKRGMLTITSAGNEGGNSWKYITAPADAFNNIAVGALTYDSARAYFSSVGPSSDGRIKPDISALGVGVDFLSSSGYLSYGNGTSYSAPIVTGIAAATWGRYKEWSMREIRGLLLSWGVNNTAPNNSIGAGLIRFKVKEEVITDVFNPNANIYIFPNPVSDFLVIKGLIQGSTISIYDVSGRTSHAVDYIDGKIDLRHFSSGTYILQIINKNGFKNYKFIKE